MQTTRAMEKTMSKKIKWAEGRIELVGKLVGREIAGCQLAMPAKQVMSCIADFGTNGVAQEYFVDGMGTMSIRLATRYGTNEVEVGVTGTHLSAQDALKYSQAMAQVAVIASCLETMLCSFENGLGE